VNHEKKKELLAYYWAREPVYHPTKGAPMPPKTVWKIRMFAAFLFAVYMAFTLTIVSMSNDLSIIQWLTGIVLGAYCADLLSGFAHMYIDFGESIRKNPLHKELFLSRVHHHELFRPAKLNYASLWFSPALYSFLVLAVFPVLLKQALPRSWDLYWFYPFWLSVLWFSSVSQIAHAFAHGKAGQSRVKAVIALLQKLKLIVPPRVHARHHREIDCNFSVLNGWSIPLLNVIFKKWIECRVSDSTAPMRQKADMKLKLSYPYEEIL